MVAARVQRTQQRAYHVTVAQNQTNANFELLTAFRAISPSYLLVGVPELSLVNPV